MRQLKNRCLFLMMLCLAGFAACKSTTPLPPSQAAGNKSTQGISASGIVQQQGVTTYQYGTHILVDVNGNTIYALKSDVVPLNNYMGKKVELQGIPVEGYPIEGGPEYLEVVTIHE
jgi:hypothetical protein